MHRHCVTHRYHVVVESVDPCITDTGPRPRQACPAAGQGSLR